MLWPCWNTHDGMCDLCAGVRMHRGLGRLPPRPEHKFPAGLDDCVFATGWIAGHAAELEADGKRLAVVDSAGGNLAAAAALRIRALKPVHPCAGNS